jgi:hypothetical protein
LCGVADAGTRETVLPDFFELLNLVRLSGRANALRPEAPISYWLWSTSLQAAGSANREPPGLVLQILFEAHFRYSIVFPAILSLPFSISSLKGSAPYPPAGYNNFNLLTSFLHGRKSGFLVG